MICLVGCSRQHRRFSGRVGGGIIVTITSMEFEKIAAALLTMGVPT
jgi:hypothetical protein